MLAEAAVSVTVTLPKRMANTTNQTESTNPDGNGMSEDSTDNYEEEDDIVVVEEEQVQFPGMGSGSDVEVLEKE